MSNSFAYNIIPPSGSALIAQATAANPIVFVEALSCTLAAESDEDLASKNASWYTGKTGQIQAVSATDNRAHIVCRFSNAGSEQVAKSIAITAKLSSQADTDAVILCAKSDPDSDARLPGSEQIGQFVEFSFTIEINGSSTVTATPGASATMADLDRFVSAHSAGNPTAGDAQSIRGVKDFLNDVYFEGTVYGDGSKLLVANSIYPEESVNYSLGTQSLVWEEVWGATGYFGSVYADSIYKNSSDISAISVMSDLSMYANIIPGTTNAYALGDADHKFKDAYFSGTVNAGGLAGTAPSEDTVHPTYIELPVGGIVVAILDSNNVSNFSPTITSLYVGDEVTLTQGANAVKTGTWGKDGTWSSAGNRLLPNGTYVLLTSPETPASSSDFCPVLLQRIS